MPQVFSIPPGRRHRRLALGAVGALTACALPALQGVAQAGTATHRPEVTQWVTGPGPAAPRSGPVTSPAAGAAVDATVRVDPTTRFQRVAGFGASLTDSSAHVLYGLKKAQRDTVMRELFDPRTGNGLNFLRQPIGASDFAVGGHYSFDDMPRQDRLRPQALQHRP